MVVMASTLLFTFVEELAQAVGEVAFALPAQLNPPLSDAGGPSSLRPSSLRIPAELAEVRPPPSRPPFPEARGDRLNSNVPRLKRPDGIECCPGLLG